MIAFKFRPQVESLDERIVPDASPTPPLMTFEQTEALLVAEQTQLTDLEAAVRADTDALLQAEANHDESAIRSDMVQLANAVVSFGHVKADYDGVRTAYEASANLASRAVPVNIGGFSSNGVNAFVAADLTRVNFVLAQANSAIPPDFKQGEAVQAPPAPPVVVPPRQLEDMGDPSTMTDADLASWAEWLGEQIDSYQAAIADAQDAIRIHTPRRDKLLVDIRAENNVAAREALIEKLWKENEILDNAKKDIEEYTDKIDELQEALDQVEQEQRDRAIRVQLLQIIRQFLPQ